MSYRPEALLATAIADLLPDQGHIAVGASSPIPGTAALLKREMGKGAVKVTILGSRSDNDFTDGGKELFDVAAQGRLDAFFLGGAQIDGQANINLVGVGGYPRSKVRFSGSFGSSYLYFLVPRVILFTWAHSPRVLVPQVEFISAPGTSPANVYRPGGPHALVTDKCVFDFVKVQQRFRLRSVHPGCSVADIVENTGFKFDIPTQVTTTREPSAWELDRLGSSVGRQIAEVYPAFAARALGIHLGGAAVEA